MLMHLYIKKLWSHEQENEEEMDFPQPSLGCLLPVPLATPRTHCPGSSSKSLAVAAQKPVSKTTVFLVERFAPAWLVPGPAVPLPAAGCCLGELAKAKAGGREA